MASSLAFASSLPASVRRIRKPDPAYRKASAIASASSSSSSSGAWWVPIFGWPSGPDYVDGKTTSGNGDSGKQSGVSDEAGPGRARSKFAPGCFTEEKARQLRRKTAEGSSFHDVMYHSAIASRLATDVSGRANK